MEATFLIDEIEYIFMLEEELDDLTILSTCWSDTNFDDFDEENNNHCGYWFKVSHGHIQWSFNLFNSSIPDKVKRAAENWVKEFVKL